MNRRTLLTRAGLLIAAGGGAWWAREQIFWPAPEAVFGLNGRTPWLPMIRPAAQPTVRVAVNGVETVALIDSGAGYSVIDRAWRRRMGGSETFAAPMVAFGLGGRAQLGRGVEVEVGLPGLTIRDLHAAVLDLGPLAGEGGLGTPLILGQDVLRRTVLELDPAMRRLRLVARDDFVADPTMIAASVSRRGGLTTEVTVDGATVRALIDTGASSLLAMDRSTARAAGLLDGRAVTRSDSLVLGGLLAAHVVEARTVTFARQLYRGVSVGLYDQPPLPNFPGALIGMAAFEGRRVALDLGGGALHVSRLMDISVGPPLRAR